MPTATGSYLTWNVFTVSVANLVLIPVASWRVKHGIWPYDKTAAVTVDDRRRDDRPCFGRGLRAMAGRR